MLKSLLADGPLILYFYPADFTPGCTKEACSFRDLHQELLKARLRVVGVSPQDVASHQRFAEKHDLNFPLLADPDKKVVIARLNSGSEAPCHPPRTRRTDRVMWPAAHLRRECRPVRSAEKRLVFRDRHGLHCRRPGVD